MLAAKLFALFVLWLPLLALLTLLVEDFSSPFTRLGAGHFWFVTFFLGYAGILALATARCIKDCRRYVKDCRAGWTRLDAVGRRAWGRFLFRVAFAAVAVPLGLVAWIGLMRDGRWDVLPLLLATTLGVPTVAAGLFAARPGARP